MSKQKLFLKENQSHYFGKKHILFFYIENIEQVKEKDKTPHFTILQTTDHTQSMKDNIFAN